MYTNHGRWRFWGCLIALQRLQGVRGWIGVARVVDREFCIAPYSFRRNINKLSREYQSPSAGVKIEKPKKDWNHANLSTGYRKVPASESSFSSSSVHIWSKIFFLGSRSVLGLCWLVCWLFFGRPVPRVYLLGSQRSSFFVHLSSHKDKLG